MNDKKYLINKKKYINSYNSSNYTQVILRIKKDDIDIINKLNSVESKNNYITELIRKDIYKK